MKKKIITHPGKAHFDEFLALSLILAIFPETDFDIFRKEPEEKELDDPEIWVVDIGGRHEPEKKNFDHHQDLSILSSFCIVGDYLGLSETMSIMPWWDFKEKMDRLGPHRLAESMGVEDLEPAYSPLESWMIGWFENDPSATLPVMRKFGAEIIKEAQELKTSLDLWHSCERRTIKGREVIIGLTDDSTGMDAYWKMVDGKKAAACVSWDSRGKGWKLYRFGDFPGVDFSRIENHPAIKFAHKGGFVAKTHERLPLEQILELVEMSMDN